MLPSRVGEKLEAESSGIAGGGGHVGPIFEHRDAVVSFGGGPAFVAVAGAHVHLALGQHADATHSAERIQKLIVGDDGASRRI